MIGWILAIAFIVVVFLYGYHSKHHIEPWQAPKERA